MIVFYFNSIRYESKSLLSKQQERSEPTINFN